MRRGSNVVAALAGVIWAVSVAAFGEATAQVQAPPPAPVVEPGEGAESAPAVEPDINLADFKALVSGKTLYFELADGTPWGREYYIPGTQDSVFIFTDGTCFDGYWRAEGERYCYYYRDEPSCWLTFWDEGMITVISRTGMLQRVVKIAENEPLSCEPAIISRLQSTPASPIGG